MIKNKKTLSILVVLGFVLSLYSTGIVSAGLIADQQAEAKVGIVYSTGGLGDQSFNDAAKRGINEALEEYSGLNVTERCESDCTTPDITNAIEDLAETNEFDLIIGIGFSAADGINSSALAHPDQDFMIIDSSDVKLDNVAGVTFKEHQGSFLVGALAAMVTKTNKIAFLGGLDIPLINRFGAGFEDGAKYINDSIEVLKTYSPNPNEPFSDVTGGKNVGETFLDDGADIIYAAAGATGLGVIEAVNETNNEAGETISYAIGVDSNQDHVSPGDVLTSMIKRVDVAVKTQIDALMDGTWSSGITTLGLEDKAVGISPMNYTKAEANATYEGNTTRWQKVMEIKQAIIDGEIDVAESYSELEDQFDESSFQLPQPILPVFLSLISTVAIVNLVRRYR